MFKKWFLKVAVLLLIAIPGMSYAQTPSEAEAKSLLSAFVSYTDLRMRSVQQGLETLASTAEAKSGAWENMSALLSGYQESDGGLIVWFLRPDGTYYTVDKGLVTAKLSDRSYFNPLMSGQKTIGDVVVSKSTGLRSAVIAVPIVENGKVIGAIGVSLFLDKLSEQITAALALRENTAFFAVAPSGLTTLHKMTDRHFVDPREQGSESLRKAANEMLSTPAGEMSYRFDNVARTAVYRTSPLTQWKFAITFGEAGQK